MNMPLVVSSCIDLFVLCHLNSREILKGTLPYIEVKVQDDNNQTE